MDTSDSEITRPGQSQTGPKQPRSWRERLGQVLSLIAISWLGLMLLELTVLYHYAWQKGLYPKPGAPSSLSIGPWCCDLLLEEGVRELLNPPFYAFIFALSSLIVKPSWRAGIALALSIVFLFLAFAHIGLVDD